MNGRQQVCRRDIVGLSGPQCTPRSAGSSVKVVIDRPQRNHFLTSPLERRPKALALPPQTQQNQACVSRLMLVRRKFAAWPESIM